MPDAAASIAEKVRAGDRHALAKAITLLESTRPDDREAAVQLLKALTPAGDASLRLGISGVPGVGKSSFIECFGLRSIERGHRIAVLAVDPSSSLSGGSILGDKTRMAELSRHPSAFIRPSPAGGTLGGVARHTRETIAVCEAAGFDLVIVETVGVGQSETAVADLSDMFILLLLPGGGDELQGIKRGIVELADLVLINKADGELQAAAERAAQDYRNALSLLKPHTTDWQVPVQTCSARTGVGIDEVYDTVMRFRATTQRSGEFAERRRRQSRTWLWRETRETLNEMLRSDPELGKVLDELEQRLDAGRLLPTVAARQLIAAFLEKHSS
jgi:LAO/AO transport system kinase